ncbi:MAG TPA: hypothetical protein VEU30_12775, partial [Thermoanaerobaculia bacterium]|nr:hypothetical protein [Thermoanaerobaculia bacterium]
MRIRNRVLPVLMLAALVACRGREEPARVTVVTTPDVGGTGVAAMLTERFARESKVRVSLIVTEERLVAELVERGIADAVLTVSPALQQDLRKRGAVRLAQTIAYNDYLLVGPKRDPARAKTAKTAAEALRRIARRDRAFCSPVDVPELRHREALLWEASPAEPRDDRRYRTCHGSAAEVLEEASRRGAYTLTDRATFEDAGKAVDLVPILQGTPLLHN